MSSKYPVKKQPIREPIEAIINMKDTSPMVAPTRSFKSSRVGPMTPTVKPNTLRKHENRIRIPVTTMAVTATHERIQQQDCFPQEMPGVFLRTLQFDFLNLALRHFSSCLLSEVLENLIFVVVKAESTFLTFSNLLWIDSTEQKTAQVD